MDYDKLEAGRELDALVAQIMLPGPFSFYDGEWWHSIPGDGDLECNVPIPYYSTDIAAAWEVVRQFENQPFYFRVSSTYRQRAWTVILTMTPNPKERDVAYADTAPLAICRAALKAVEEVE